MLGAEATGEILGLDSIKAVHLHCDTGTRLADAHERRGQGPERRLHHSHERGPGIRPQNNDHDVAAARGVRDGENALRLGDHHAEVGQLITPAMDPWHSAGSVSARAWLRIQHWPDGERRRYMAP